ncbi:MAG TPA: histidine phosphatase family protein [Candidatus Gallacutalibacter stercoravium]|nr:histidine phosphatase family protein [Candidatus Gallacutalibacter stercoravium]
MKSYQIHLIRHGMTQANLQGRYIGSTDVPLSQEGIEQLKQYDKRYRYPGAAVFYSSPLQRCVQTMKLLYPQVEPQLVPGLAECNFGQWEGKTAQELQNDELFAQWLENGQQISPPGGESGKEFAYRVCSAFEKLVEGMLRSGQTQAVVVTHGGVIMTLMAAYALPRASSFDWMVDSACGYSLRIIPGLWMRDMVAEAYATLPQGKNAKAAQHSEPILNIAREAAERAYHTEEHSEDSNS